MVCEAEYVGNTQLFVNEFVIDILYLGFLSFIETSSKCNLHEHHGLDC